MEPQSRNVTVGEVVVFQCEHSSAAILGWKINGTLLNDQPDLENDFIDTTAGRLHTLTVTALSKYNSTSIQCLTARESEATDTAILQIQGELINNGNSDVISTTLLIKMYWNSDIL